jgi:hypothetical protein
VSIDQSNSAEVLDVESCIEGLLLSDEYGTLGRIRPEFDLFELLGSLNENASSRALAFLLDSNADHGLGTAFYEAFMEQVYRASKENADAEKITLNQYVGLSAFKTTTVTEWSTRTSERRFLDILINVFDSHGNQIGVVGIENKHWAIEQHKQVGDYQTEIVKRFPDPKQIKLLLFLAPQNRHSETAQRDCECRYVPCSYKSVVSALDQLENISSPELKLLISSLKIHLGKNLEGSTSMTEKIRELVHKLYQTENHRNAIKNIMANIPRLGALVDGIQSMLADHVNSKGFSEGKFEFSTYPRYNRDRLAEMYLFPESLKERTHKHQFHFKYVLHAPQSNVPDLGDVVRMDLMIWVENNGDKTEAERIAKLLELPKQTSEKIKRFWNWVSIWGGGSHKLVDLGQKDTEACMKLFTDAIDATYEIIRDTVNKKYEPVEKARKTKS